MFKRIREFFKGKSLPVETGPLGPKANTVQENPVVSRVKEAFKQQKQEIQLRALKPHQCNDPLSCEKDPCWVFEPDKLVGESYKIIATPERVQAQRRVKRLYKRMMSRKEQAEE